MKTSLSQQLDALSAWRGELQQRIAELTQFLAQNDLAAHAERAAIDSLARKLAAEKLVLACVAEVSRGKSELLNAIFFANAGRRILPATPGRTTMCPVELHFHAGQPAELALLPIDTRLSGAALGELRNQPAAWQRLGLDPRNPDGLAEALLLVTQTRRVSTAHAGELGLWSDSEPDDNPPLGADGLVEVPAWRHALINYPHPLLERGLVVIDTPGLNAIGAEPDLTLGLLPSAHAIVFLVGADTGVTRSDLTIWNEHLGGAALERFVVLNKVDILDDPLSSADVSAHFDAPKSDVGPDAKFDGGA
ncbi:MAG: dynamin family protein, partial [Rubrivivax sp.]